MRCQVSYDRQTAKMFRKDAVMTLDEAKEFYFRYNGYAFHMDREEPRTYAAFKQLEISSDTLREWDEELLEGLFETLESGNENVWAAHGNILKIIARNRCDTAGFLLRLLDAMEGMDSLDPSVLTLIIENMAGRNASMNDGGVYLICRYTPYALRMDATMHRLIDACSASCKEDDRAKRAAQSYIRAYDRWKNGYR